MSASDVLAAIDAGEKLYRAHAQGTVELIKSNGDRIIVPTTIFDAL